MTYKELTKIISALTEEQQNQDVSISCAPEIYPLHRALVFYGDDSLDDGHFVLEI